jgi:hypothetical protein
MWCRFGFESDKGGREADAPTAGGSNPIAEPAGNADRSPPIEEQAGEAEAFLARFYTHQQC